MKRLAAALIGAGIISVMSADAYAACGTLEVSKGDIKIQSGQTKKVDPAPVGAKICSGDTILAGKDSRAKLKMADGNELNVSPESKIVLETYQFDPAQNKKKVLLNILQGKVRAATQKDNMYNDKAADGQANTFQVKTKSAVAGVRGTDFMTGFDPKTNRSEVVTFKGKVEFGQPGPGGTITNSVQVGAGQKTMAAPGQPPAPPRAVPARELEKANSDTKADGGTSPSGAGAAGDSGAKPDGEKKDDSSSGEKNSSGESSARDEKKPAAEEKKSGGEDKKPAVEEKKPATEEKKGSAEEKRAPSEEKKSAGEQKRPAAGDQRREPAANDGASTGGASGGSAPSGNAPANGGGSTQTTRPAQPQPAIQPSQGPVAPPPPPPPLLTAPTTTQPLPFIPPPQPVAPPVAPTPVPTPAATPVPAPVATPAPPPMLPLPPPPLPTPIPGASPPPYYPTPVPTPYIGPTPVPGPSHLNININY